VFRASIDTTSIVLAYFCFPLLRRSQDRRNSILILISRDDKLKESLPPFEDHCGRAKNCGAGGVMSIQRATSRTVVQRITAHTTLPLFTKLASRSLPKQSFYIFFSGISNRHSALYHSGNRNRTAMASMKAANRLMVAFDEGKGPSMGCW
jgi:hypothetical protein